MGEKTPKPKTTQQRFESEFLVREMSGFDSERSPAWQYLSARYEGLTKDTLLALGEITARQLDIPITREFKRRKETLVKWFHNNWDVVKPFLDTRVTVHVAHLK
jgi:hypothetical protein